MQSFVVAGLGATGPWLVILDNLEEVEADEEWLLHLQGGGLCVLLTARRGHWPCHLGLRI